MNNSVLFASLAGLCAIGVAIFGFLAAHADRKSQDSNANQTAAQLAETKTEIARLGAEMGSADMAKKYVELRRASQRFSEATIAAKADQALKSKDDHQKFRDEVEDANNKFAVATHARFQPIQDLVVDCVDAWVAALQKRGAKIECVSGTNEVATTNTAGNDVPIRTVKFSTGAEITVSSYTAIISDSRVATPYNLRFYFSGEKKGVLIWSYSTDGRSVSLDNYYQSIYPFKGFQKEMPPVPIDDAQITDGLRSAIDDSFGYLVHEADPSL